MTLVQLRFQIKMPPCTLDVIFQLLKYADVRFEGINRSSSKSNTRHPKYRNTYICFHSFRNMPHSDDLRKSIHNTGSTFCRVQT